MINLNEYIQDEEEILFLEEIRLALSEDYQNEVLLKYKDIPLLLEPHGKEVQVWSKEKQLGVYETVDDMLLKLVLDGKAFIERIAEIDYE